MTGPKDPGGDDWGFPEVDPAGPASTQLPAAEPEPEVVYDTGSDAWWRAQAQAQRAAAAHETPASPGLPPRSPAESVLQSEPLLPPPPVPAPEPLAPPLLPPEPLAPPEPMAPPEPVGPPTPVGPPEPVRPPEPAQPRQPDISPEPVVPVVPAVQPTPQLPPLELPPQGPPLSGADGFCFTTMNSQSPRLALPTGAAASSTLCHTKRPPPAQPMPMQAKSAKE